MTVRQVDFDEKIAGTGKRNWAAVKQAVKDGVSIFEVAEHFGVKLQGHRTQQLRCPFHGVDRKPSARIFSETDSFHCWACGRDGDQIWMAMEFLEEPFGKAISYLAKVFEIEAPEATEEFDDRPWSIAHAKTFGSPDEEDEVMTLRDAHTVLSNSLKALYTNPTGRADVLERLDSLFWGLDPEQEIPRSAVLHSVSLLTGTADSL